VPSSKKIHIAVPNDLHTKLRVRCAYEDQTIQDYVASLIAEDITNYVTKEKIAIPPHKLKAKNKRGIEQESD
jgi:hypothetical protein